MEVPRSFGAVPPTNSLQLDPACSEIKRGQVPRCSDIGSGPSWGGSLLSQLTNGRFWAKLSISFATKLWQRQGLHDAPRGRKILPTGRITGGSGINMMDHDTFLGTLKFCPSLYDCTCSTRASRKMPPLAPRPVYQGTTMKKNEHQYISPRVSYFAHPRTPLVCGT